MLPANRQDDMQQGPGWNRERYGYVVSILESETVMKSHTRLNAHLTMCIKHIVLLLRTL